MNPLNSKFLPGFICGFGEKLQATVAMITYVRARVLMDATDVLGIGSL